MATQPRGAMKKREPLSYPIDNAFGRALLRLSRQEGRVLLLVARGYSNKEIAERMYLSIRTVQNHRYHIGKKLGIAGRGNLSRWARTHYYGKENS